MPPSAGPASFASAPLRNCSTAPKILAKRPRISRSGLAVITNAGGPGVMAADTLEDYDLEPAVLSDTTMEALNEQLPSCWSCGNPIDIQGDASPEKFCETVKTCLEAREIDAILILFAPQATVDATKTAEMLSVALEGARKPVFYDLDGGTVRGKGESRLQPGGHPDL